MVSKATRRALCRLQLAAMVAFVVVLTALDIRDLNYKINWVGPYINYRFAAVGPNVLNPAKLQLAVNMTTPGMLLRRPTGWSSFLEKCESLSPVTRSKTFRSLMGRNCTVGSRVANVTYERLVMAGSVRVDSVAWACCQLLEPNRQPPVCNAPIVRGFDARYSLQPVPVLETWVAPNGSLEEAELLGLLNVIGMSTPLSQVTCVEGFELKGEGQYYSEVFGCGAPNYFRSAFAGHFAVRLRELHRDLAYLTVDNINLMGFQYKIRENCVSDFKVATNAATGALGITHTTTMNFSSYGQLYALMIVIDVVLMLVNLFSALQLLFGAVIPAYMSEEPQALDNLEREGVASYLSCSLYRSPIIMVLLVASQLASWLIIIPNAVTWTWGNSQTAKVQAYLSSIRTWTLMLVVLNNAWDLVVFFHERLAFTIAQHTFITSAEIIAIGAYISYHNRAKMFAIADAKYKVEKQRNSDTTTFVNFTGACNSFNNDLDNMLNTPTEVLWIVYKPLFTVLSWSLLAIVVYAAAKFVLIYFTPQLARRITKRDLYFTAGANNKYAVSAREEKDDSDGTLDSSGASASNSGAGGMVVTTTAIAASTGAVRRSSGNAVPQRSPSSVQSFGITHLSRFGMAEGSIAENTAVAHAMPASASAPAPKLYRRGYARLPLEELLNNPIRARSLVRTTVSLEHVVNYHKFVSAQLYLEFGVFFVGGRMKPRWGFLSPVPPVVHVDNTVVSDMIQPLTPAEQLSMLRPATGAAKKPSSTH